MNLEEGETVEEERTDDQEFLIKKPVLKDIDSPLPNAKIDLQFLKRMFKLFKFFGYQLKGAQTAIFLIGIILMIGVVITNAYLAYIFGQVFGMIASKEIGSATIKLCIGFAIVGSGSIAKSILIFFSNTLAYLWRKHLTNNLTNIYLKNHNYFSILLLNSQCDNIDQRIVADSTSLTTSLASKKKKKNFIPSLLYFKKNSIYHAISPLFVNNRFRKLPGS